MNTLEASRALNVLQDKMLKDSVGEEEFFSDFGDVGIEYDELGRAMPSMPVDYRPLPPETLPTDDDDNPFPGLDRPLG